MKIAVLARTMFPIRKPFFGGMEMHTYTLVEQLLQRGHEVTLYAAKGSDPKLNVVSLTKPQAKYFGSTQQYQLIKRFRQYARSRQLEIKFAEAINTIASRKFDIIHNNSLHTLPIRYAHLRHIPVLTTLHVPPVREMKRGIARTCDYPLHRVVTVSHNNAALWHKAIGFKPDVIYNGLDLDRWEAKTTLPDRKFAVWVGRITPEKGPDYAIEACKLADIDLKIIGPIADEGYFERRIQPQLDKRITYYGHLSHEIINHITLTSSVVIVSSVWEEPFGLVIAEALATGTPVAGFRIGAIPEIVTPMTGELATTRNVSELASAIRLCATKDPAKCRASTEQRFSIGTMMDNYEAAYEALLVKRRELELAGQFSPLPISRPSVPYLTATPRPTKLPKEERTT